MVADSSVNALICAGTAVGLATAAYFAQQVAKIKLGNEGEVNSRTPILAQDRGHLQGGKESDEFHMDIHTISNFIAEGANAFLYQEYRIVSIFIFFFGLLLLFLLGGTTKDWTRAVLTTMAFVSGAVTSIISGFIGMRIAVYTNSRTAISAQAGVPDGRGFEYAFDTSFKGGAVMGFALVSIGLIVLFVLICLFNLYWSAAFGNSIDTPEQTKAMFEAIAGYGLGGSSIALFGRVGGGIYTKAADVGADLAGKVEAGLKEDDPRNPAVIADNVGDNVGDIAGMGADLFGSFAESSCAAMVISSQSPDLYNSWAAMLFPLALTASGIFVCLATTFVATHLMKTKTQKDIEPSLKRQLLVSTVLMTPVIFAICYTFFPSTFDVSDTVKNVHNYHIFFCVTSGLWAGLIIGYTTEYYTSHSYTPVREVAGSCATGAATNIIYGLALGYKSVIIPCFCLAITIYVGLKLAGMYGIAVAALGILSTIAIGLTIDSYGPICDNAGGIAEMSGMPEEVRDVTDALDAAGNTTAAIGKGFAIGSAALVSLALFGAFVTICGLSEHGINILQPFEFCGLLIGAMLPYWFSAMTMKSVGKAALDMVNEVRRQFATAPVDANGNKDFSKFQADYKTCVAISTAASLREMIAPGALVMLTPIIVGFFFGTRALAGVLAGALVSGVQIAISASNTGGAWDNAKKYIESGGIPGERKGGNVHKAAVVGDTVGDPLKDTSGPSLNILIKLMAIISVVFGPSFPSIGNAILEKVIS